MLDFDSGKLLIIGIVALVVIGPKDLPRVLRQVGQMVTRVRRMAGEFQGQFMEAMKEADLQDLRSEVAKLKDTAKLDVDFDPVRDAKHELMTAMNGTGSDPSVTEAGAAVPRASKSFPSTMSFEDTPALAAAGIGPVAEALPDAAPVIASEASEAASPEPPRRRKVQVSRRGTSRIGARTGLPGRSRNILPARLETPDR